MSAVQHEIGSSDLVPERGRYIVDIEGTTIGIFRLDGVLYAYENICAHQGGPVCQGRIVPRVRERLDDAKQAIGLTFDETDMHIVCPWHGFEYSITTGIHAGDPSFRLRAFPVEEREGTIYVTC
ncbi:Rieske (2Fe-2S) protein [Longimycelium tulufanense]|uniref:Rieske (2Fe-2S) protein n=1 Tax=Longimycelium tulufanense TaxID=907463 RepID=UPI001E620426|nr:Rieske (2Fe-2S) protein [Longimycelium tulufanense]